MEEMLIQAYSENKPLLTGDFNIDLLKEDSTTLRTAWESIYENFERNQIIDEPTRTTDKTQTLIDHLCCTADLPVLKHVVVKYGLSDHFPIPCILGVFDVKTLNPPTMAATTQ